LGSAPPVPILGNAGDGRPPRFLGNPPDGSPGSWTPVGPARQAVAACRRGPRLCQPRGLPTSDKVSRLDVQAFRLAVYASQGGSLHHHARRASGCWPALPGGIRTRRVPTEGFRAVVVTSHPPSPGFAWRNDTIFLISVVSSWNSACSASTRCSGRRMGRTAWGATVPGIAHPTPNHDEGQRPTVFPPGRAHWNQPLSPRPRAPVRGGNSATSPSSTRFTS